MRIRINTVRIIIDSVYGYAQLPVPSYVCINLPLKIRELAKTSRAGTTGQQLKRGTGVDQSAERPAMARCA